MAQEWAEWFYTSGEWKACRASYVKKRVAIDGGLCELCREEQGCICHHVEHITPANINDPYVTLNHSNLQYLCYACHKAVHGNNFIPRCYVFDADGNPIKR